MIFDREAVQSANCREFVGSNSSFNAQLAQVDGLLPVGTETFEPLALGLDFCELEPSEWRGYIDTKMGNSGLVVDQADPTPTTKWRRETQCIRRANYFKHTKQHDELLRKL